MQLNLFETQIPVSSDFSEYFFLLSPPETIKQKIKERKRKLNEMIGISNENLFSVPHISLLLYSTKNLPEAMMRRAAAVALMDLQCFDISIKRIDRFDHPRTNDIIYKFEDPSKIVSVAEHLHYILNVPFDAKRFTPHMTLARGIMKNDFAKVAGSLSEFDLKASFQCEKVTVLKRTANIYNGRVVKRTKYNMFEEVNLG